MERTDFTIVELPTYFTNSIDFLLKLSLADAFADANSEEMAKQTKIGFGGMPPGLKGD
ncbi:hypothetical protein N9D23_13945 [Rubripirellula sp.]|nr:hypothetical protein [Rubripirellula sp.]